MNTHAHNNLRDLLVAAGHMTETGTTRRARVRSCRCGADIVVGLDRDMCAIEARVDPQALTALGEALAILDGRYTATARHHGGRIVLDARGGHDIAHQPAGTTPRQDIHREHRCHTPPPAGAALATPQLVTQQPKEPTRDAEPPF